MNWKPNFRMASTSLDHKATGKESEGSTNMDVYLISDLL